MAFEGFRPEARRFLADLGENNNRDWFQAHRDVYEQFVLEPARDFVEAMGVELEQFAPGVHADPRVNGSIMRINRDTRFSRDKRPYKDHLDLWFWQGDGSSRTSPGYWFRLTPQKLVLGAGKHHFEPELLDRYREAVADAERGESLQAALQEVESAGYDVGGRRYKRLPRGYDVPDERADLLLHDSLYAGIEQPVPKEVETSGFPAFCARHYRNLAPLQSWLLALTK